MAFIWSGDLFRGEITFFNLPAATKALEAIPDLIKFFTSSMQASKFFPSLPSRLGLNAQFLKGGKGKREDRNQKVILLQRKYTKNLVYLRS